jgi:hypothetical protein
LVEIDFEAIGFEQVLIIGEIVVALIIGFVIKAFDQQTPPPVAVSKIYRAIHRFRSPFQKPSFTLVKERKSRLLVVNTFKKTHSSGRLIIAFTNRFLVNKYTPRGGRSYFSPGQRHFQYPYPGDVSILAHFYKV